MSYRVIFFFPWSLLFLISSDFKEKYRHLQTEEQTPLAAAETTSGATMTFSGDLPFPWLQNSVFKLKGCSQYVYRVFLTALFK